MFSFSLENKFNWKFVVQYLLTNSTSNFFLINSEAEIKINFPNKRHFINKIIFIVWWVNFRIRPKFVSRRKLKTNWNFSLINYIDKKKIFHRFLSKLGERGWKVSVRRFDKRKHIEYLLSIIKFLRNSNIIEDLDSWKWSVDLVWDFLWNCEARHEPWCFMRFPEGIWFSLSRKIFREFNLWFK